MGRVLLSIFKIVRQERRNNNILNTKAGTLTKKLQNPIKISQKVHKIYC